MGSENALIKPESVILDALLDGHTTARELALVTKLPIREVIKVLGHPMFSAGFEALTLQATRTQALATSLKVLFEIIQTSENDESRIKAITKLGELLNPTGDKETYELEPKEVKSFKGLA